MNITSQNSGTLETHHSRTLLLLASSVFLTMAHMRTSQNQGSMAIVWRPASSTRSK